MGVSKNRGGPSKWMSYKWKTLFFNGWFGGKTPLFLETSTYLLKIVGWKMFHFLLNWPLFWGNSLIFGGVFSGSDFFPRHWKLMVESLLIMIPGPKRSQMLFFCEGNSLIWNSDMKAYRMFKWVFPKIVVPPESSILIRFSIIKHPFWGPTPIFGNTQMVFPGQP